MYDADIRIAVISASDIERIGTEYNTAIQYEIVDSKHEIKTTGHVNLVGGQRFSIRLKRYARLLTREEIFGEEAN